MESSSIEGCAHHVTIDKKRSKRQHERSISQRKKCRSQMRRLHHNLKWELAFSPGNGREHDARALLSQWPHGNHEETRDQIQSNYTRVRTQFHDAITGLAFPQLEEGHRHTFAANALKQWREIRTSTARIKIPRSKRKERMKMASLTCNAESMHEIGKELAQTKLTNHRNKLQERTNRLRQAFSALLRDYHQSVK